MNTHHQDLIQYDSLLWKMAHQWRGKYMMLDLDDLRQQACLGLMKARERFDPEKGSFVAYAMLWMNHFIRKYVADFRDVVRVPEGVMFKVTIRTCSLDAPMFDDSVATFLENVPAPEPEELLMDDGDTLKRLREAMKDLTPIERDVIHARFVKEMPLRDIGLEKGLTGERIRQIQNIALKKLRNDPRLMKSAA